jgi:hypothetical protein
MQNPNHPSLQFKPVKNWAGVYSVRITLDYRALAFASGNTVTWFWIGSHSEYDGLIN